MRVWESRSPPVYRTTSDEPVSSEVVSILCVSLADFRRVFSQVLKSSQISLRIFRGVLKGSRISRRVFSGVLKGSQISQNFRGVCGEYLTLVDFAALFFAKKDGFVSMSVEILLSSSHNLNSESYIFRYFSMRIIHIALTPILFLLLTCMSCGKIELPSDTSEPGEVIPPGTDGAETDAISVEELSGVADGESVWVEGYIVGFVNGTSISHAEFTLESPVVSNLLIAKSADVTDASLCVPIQLPNNSEIRTALNLQDNPDLWHRHLYIYGVKHIYFGLPGLKPAKSYKLIEDDEETAPGENTGEVITVQSNSSPIIMEAD